MRKAIIGQEYMIERLLLAMLSNGHILLEGVPGLAKTLAINSLSKAISAKFSRIQFTPDLLPADVIGTLIYNQKENDFTVKKGPIFANLILADEINRAPSKVQSALLEAMQERQITIGDKTYKLDEPFLVLATQNPLEQEGTYPLPEAQLDRFMLKAVISYPEKEDEKLIMRNNVNQSFQKISAVLDPTSILKAREVVRKVYMDEKIENYILDIVFASRFPEKYKLDSMKNMISYAMAAKSYAFLQKRGFVIPEDIRAICTDVMRHRIGVTYEAEAENITSEDIIKEILNAVEVP
ncbi:UNVERIFIED_CONTAM: hypothetical protein GTU68_039909 [Idotea baltica]|nr:hypothetical protein [Idotea baltica]